MLAGFWQRLKAFFGFGEAEPTPVPTVKSATPKPPTHNPAPAAKADPVVTDKTASTSTWMQLYTQEAANWEADQRKYMATLGEYGRDGAAEAIMALDWAPIVKGYSDELLRMVFYDGTKLSLEGHPETKVHIQAAVRAERAIRHNRKSPRAPKGHGMAPDGRQE